jgi:hypothetical protein
VSLFAYRVEFLGSDKRELKVKVNFPLEQATKAQRVVEV